MRIAILGGSGKQGSALASRWVRAGHAVVLGSRDPENAKNRAAGRGTESATVEITGNVDAARSADVVVLCVPYAAHAETLRAVKSMLTGKTLVDLTVPLRPPRVDRVQLPPGRAAALEAQEILGPETRVVAALHHVSHTVLAKTDPVSHGDVLVAADDEQAKGTVLSLIKDLGLRGLDAGPLENAIALESLTPVLIHMNKRYRIPNAGITFTGLPETT